MKYSIIITFYSGINILDACLEHTTDTLDELCSETEIIIVNDNPGISLSSVIKKYQNQYNIKLLSMPQNGGHPAACNFGASFANGTYLIFMDCDILPTKGWLKNLESTYLSHSNAGSSSATIVDMATNRLTITGIEVHGVDCIKPLRGASLDHPYLQEDKSYTFTPSGCFLILKETFFNFGCFNEIYYNAFCDMDLSGKIYQNGYKNYVSAKALVYHRGKVAGTVRMLSTDDTKAYFFKEWGNALPDQGLQFLNYCFRQFSKKHSISKDYILINFSRSLFLGDYIESLSKNLNINLIERLNLKEHQGDVLLDDFLPTDMRQYECPFVFFSENYRNIEKNYFWFKNRVNIPDISVDINGNICFVQDFVIRNKS